MGQAPGHIFGVNLKQKTLGELLCCKRGCSSELVLLRTSEFKYWLGLIFFFIFLFNSWHISKKSVHISEISLHIHASLPVFLELEGDDIVGGFLSCREVRQ